MVRTEKFQNNLLTDINILCLQTFFEKKFIELLKIELNNIQLQSITIFLYNEEFDPGSG